MSTKSTIICTNDNEHWYSDCSEPVTDTGGTFICDAITLEFSKENIRIDLNDQDELIITLHKDSALLRTLFLSVAALQKSDAIVSPI